MVEELNYVVDLHKMDICNALFQDSQQTSSDLGWKKVVRFPDEPPIGSLNTLDG